MQLVYLDPAQIELDPAGVRENPGDLDGLAETIRDQGLLQPLGVVKLTRDHYRIVYGGRRLAAARQLQLDRVPCIVLDDDADLLLRQLIENVQRRDLNDMEKAFAFQRLRQHFTQQNGKLSEGELDARIGQAVGIAPRTVRRYLGLLDLAPEVQQLVRDEELTVTQAQHLRRVARPATQIELARMVVDEGLSAADVSNLANYFAANPELTVDAALRALEAGHELRTTIDDSVPAQAPGLRPPPEPIDGDDDLWLDEPDDNATTGDEAFAHLAVEEDPSRTKARVFKIRSLDHMVDETDRLARAYHEGDLGKWVRDDEAAPFKLRLLLKQLRSLSRAIEQLVSEKGWEIEDD